MRALASALRVQKRNSHPIAFGNAFYGASQLCFSKRWRDVCLTPTQVEDRPQCDGCILRCMACARTMFQPKRSIAIMRTVPSAVRRGYVSTPYGCGAKYLTHGAFETKSSALCRVRHPLGQYSGGHRQVRAVLRQVVDDGGASLALPPPSLLSSLYLLLVLVNGKRPVVVQQRRRTLEGG